MRHKVVALIYYISNHQVRVLTGVESYYCFEESFDSSYNNVLTELETCSPQKASQIAIYLSEKHQRRIQYGDFINNRTHFCCLTSNSHLGLIKGDVFPNELYTKAIQREIREETGIVFPESRFLDMDQNFNARTSLFLVPVNLDEVESIKRYLLTRHNSHCGELFYIDFRELVHYKMNHITRVVSEWLADFPILPTVANVEPISFEPVPESVVCKEYHSVPIEEPPFKRGVQRYSLLPL